MVIILSDYSVIAKATFHSKLPLLKIVEGKKFWRYYKAIVCLLIKSVTLFILL